MRIDYKDVRFSFRDKRIKQRRRLLTLILLLLVILGIFFFGHYQRASRSLQAAADMLLSEHWSAAQERIKAATPAFFFKRSWLELSGLTDLLAGHEEAAQAAFRKLDGPGRQTRIDYAAFCKYLSDHARYRELQIYTASLLSLQADGIWWYRGLCQMALLNAADAALSLSRLSPAFRQENEKALARLQRVAGQLSKGKIPFILDRRGQPLAQYDVSEKRSRALVPGLRFAEFDAEFRKGIRFFHLTLDRDLQEIVARLFVNHSGTFMLLDAKEGAILAAFSKPRDNSQENAVFSQEFEPGSIAKVLTLLAFLRQPRPDIFPFMCRGPMTIAGRTFYDARAHGEVRNVIDATAFSCNLSFARMGLATGYASLAEVLEKFRFNSLPQEDQFLRFKTGRFRDVSRDNFRLAKLAVGLEEITASTVQEAFVAAAIAKDGTCQFPYLIDHVSNILDLGVYMHVERSQRLFTDSSPFAKIKAAMRAVVENDLGTGHRARSEGIEVAAKTGTAGNRQRGLDALMIGFFPVADPKYAFAFRLEGGGLAEFNAAYLLRDFLVAFTRQVKDEK